SNDVWAKKNRRPKGCAAFRFWLRCSSGTAPLRGMLPHRASPKPKIDATNVVVFMKRSTKGAAGEVAKDWTAVRLPRNALLTNVICHGALSGKTRRASAGASHCCMRTNAIFKTPGMHRRGGVCG